MKVTIDIEPTEVCQIQEFWINFMLEYNKSLMHQMLSNIVEYNPFLQMMNLNLYLNGNHGE